MLFIFHVYFLSTAGKGLTSWLFCVLCFPVFFVTLPYCVPGKVWYLLVSIPDLCLPLYPVDTVQIQKCFKSSKSEVFDMHAVVG